MSDTGKRYKLSDDYSKTLFSGMTAADIAADNAKALTLAKAVSADVLGQELLSKKITADNVEEVLGGWNDKVGKLLSDKDSSGIIGTILTAGLIVATLPFTMGSAASILATKPIMEPLKRKVRPELLAAQDYISAFFRKELKLEELKERLSTIGLPDAEQKYLMSISEQLPSAQDVIRFAVREVYSPAVAARFGQFEGAKDVYNNAKTDLTNIGMTEDTFSKYWASHWALPSAQQGFEMLQRGIITKDDLNLLLKSLDIVPFWRDKLTNISYNPLTRVDVRRMHKLGILNEAQVLKAYRDIGYNDENARNLTAFTIQYNGSPEAAEETAFDTRKKYYQDISRADILKNYRDALITRQQAADMLVSLGYDINESEFLLDHEDYVLADSYRDSYTKYIKKLYTEGYIDNIKANQELNKLGINSSAIDLYLKTWELDKDIRVAAPSRADIMGFLKKKIISKETAVNELKKLGYADMAINWYLAAQGEV